MRLSTCWTQVLLRGTRNLYLPQQELRKSNAVVGRDLLFPLRRPGAQRKRCGRKHWPAAIKDGPTCCPRSPWSTMMLGGDIHMSSSGPPVAGGERLPPSTSTPLPYRLTPFSCPPNAPTVRTPGYVRYAKLTASTRTRLSGRVTCCGPLTFS